MAEKRYNQDDQQKKIRDDLADMRAKGVDAHEMHSLHPGGAMEALKEMKDNIGAVRDQNQQQREEGARRLQEASRRLRNT